jgi:hypothetical protein
MGVEINVKASLINMSCLIECTLVWRDVILTTVGVEISMCHWWIWCSWSWLVVCLLPSSLTHNVGVWKCCCFAYFSTKLSTTIWPTTTASAWDTRNLSEKLVQAILWSCVTGALQCATTPAMTANNRPGRIGILIPCCRAQNSPSAQSPTSMTQVMVCLSSTSMWIISLEPSLMVTVKNAPLKSRAGLWAYAWARLRRPLTRLYALLVVNMGEFFDHIMNIPLLLFSLLRSISFKQSDDFNPQWTWGLCWWLWLPQEIDLWSHRWWWGIFLYNSHIPRYKASVLDMLESFLWWDLSWTFWRRFYMWKRLFWMLFGNMWSNLMKM